MPWGIAKDGNNNNNFQNGSQQQEPLTATVWLLLRIPSFDSLAFVEEIPKGKTNFNKSVAPYELYLEEN